MGRLVRILTIDSLLVGLAVGAASAVGLYFYKKYNKNTKKWIPVGKVQRLCIYPLKSGRKIELNKAFCTELGVETLEEKNLFQLRDRMFVVYNEDDNDFRTARDYPKLVHVSLTAFDDKHVQLEAMYEPTLKFKIPNTQEATRITLTLFQKEEIAMFDCGNEAAEWISMCILNKLKGLRLGFYDCTAKRNLHFTYPKFLAFYKKLTNNATGMYSDLTSYLLMNQSSVDDLNEKCKADDIHMDNFRPNIIVESTSGVPFEEDDWEYVKIGNVELYYVKPCTRCLLTTVNPVTAIKSPNNEPLKTLRTYRQMRDIKKINLEGSLPVLGVHMGLQNSGGEISVGDTVYAKTF